MQVFKDYQVELIQKLPMDDTIFIALLYQNNFFSGSQKATLKAQQTEADKASYFLDSIVGRDIDSYFVTLLNVMEIFGDPIVTLAREIKKRIGLNSCQGTLYSVCVHAYVCTCVRACACICILHVCVCVLCDCIIHR